MGDHFVLLVDWLLTESTLQAAIGGKNQLQHATTLASEDMIINFSSHKMDLDLDSSQRKLVECRICHDEDEDSNMEIPCSCCGSLRYAHRGCVQRWCNEKGNTICEICHQQFKPDYTAPPPLFHYGGIPMDFSWEISRRDLHNSQFIAMVANDRNSSDTDFDEYSAPTSRSLICCRTVAIILLLILPSGTWPLGLGYSYDKFMVLLVLRHTLPFIIAGAGEYSITLFMLLMLRTIAILLPIYVMVRAFTAIQRHRNRQDPHNFSPATSDEENELPHLQPPSHLIHVR